MPTRDDFPEEIKRVLANRAANVCSNPRCGATTSGPQEDPTKALNIGVAAHITAASPGGARYDESLTPEQRKDARNGIWLCQNCAKLVDNDETQFPVGYLRAWKTMREVEARMNIGQTAPPKVDVHVSLAKNGSTDHPPQLAIKVVQPEFGLRRSGIDGTGLIVEFRLCHLGGRPATSIDVKPVFSSKGNYSIQFDLLPFVANGAEEILRFEVWKGDEPPNRKARVFGEWGHRLGDFIWDSPSKYGRSEFPVVLWYMDGSDLRNRRYRLLFDHSQDKFDMIDDYPLFAAMASELPGV